MYPKSLFPWDNVIQKYVRTKFADGTDKYEVVLKPGFRSCYGSDTPIHKFIASTLYIIRRHLSYDVRDCNCDRCKKGEVDED
jgi:hypothetical protein